MFTRLLPPLTLFAVWAAGPASAQEPAPEPQEQPSPVPRYHELVEVEDRAPALPTSAVTALKLPLPLQATPASVSVVPRSVFHAQHGFVAGDALRHAAGLNVGTGFGVFDFFVIRGFDSLTSGLVLTDGAPEPESTFYPLYNLGRVEVLKGPGAFLYGANPLAGAVHLVRKQPRPGRFADVSVSYGRFDTFETSLDANLARDDGSLSVRLNAVHRGTDSHRDDTGGDLTGINPALTWRPGPDTVLSLNLEYVRSEFAPDSGLPVVGSSLAPVPRTRSYQSPFDSSEQDVYRLRFDTEHRLSDRLSLRGKLYSTDLDWLSHGTLLNGVQPNRQGGLDVARSQLQLDDRQRLLGVQAEAVLHASTGGVAHELLAGVEVSRLADEFTLDVALLPGLDLFVPRETARLPLFVVPSLGSRGDARSRAAAVYAVDRARLTRTLDLVAGARLDVLDYEDEVSGTRRDPARVSPVLGVVYAVTPEVSLYASAGTAFAPPSTLVTGEREPEDSRQIELGAKARFLERRGLASLAVYHLERDGIAIPDGTGVLRQTGDQRSRGLELELSFEARADSLVTLAYAFNDAELTRFAEQTVVGLDPATGAPVRAVLDRSGHVPAFAPRHLFSLWGTARLPGGVSLGLGARYVGRQFIAEDNAFELDEHLLLDAAASLTTGRVTWSLALHNLTDREYGTRGFGANSVLPGRPFSASGRLELRLGPR